VLQFIKSLRGDPFFTFNLPGWRRAPLPPSVTPLVRGHKGRQHFPSWEPKLKPIRCWRAALDFQPKYLFFCWFNVVTWIKMLNQRKHNGNRAFLLGRFHWSCNIICWLGHGLTVTKERGNSLTLTAPKHKHLWHMNWNMHNTLLRNPSNVIQV